MVANTQKHVKMIQSYKVTFILTELVIIRILGCENTVFTTWMNPQSIVLHKHINHAQHSNAKKLLDLGFFMCTYTDWFHKNEFARSVSFLKS